MEKGSVLGGETMKGGSSQLPEGAVPYQPGEPVPTAFKEMPKLPWEEKGRPQGEAAPEDAETEATPAESVHVPSFIIAVAAILAFGALGYWRLNRKRKVRESRV